MTPTSRIAISFASIGTIGGGIGMAIGLIDSKNQNALKFKLISEGFSTEIDESEWDKILIDYVAGFNRNTFKTKEGENKNKDWIKSKCKEILNKEDKEKVNYGLAIQWCVKPEKINDILNKKTSKFRLLNYVDTETNADKSFWTQIITSLSQTENSNSKVKLGVTLNGNDEDTKIKEVKGKCREINEFKTTSQGFGEKFELSKKWCSILKAN